MKIQRLCEKDVDAMLVLQDQYFNQTVRDQQYMIRTSENGFRRAFEFQNFVFGAFDNDGMLQAFITCTIPTSKAKMNLGILHLDYNDRQSDELGEIHVVLVSNNFYGQGIGSALLSVVINEFKSRAMTTLLTTIDPKNTRSISLFKKYGFIIVKSIEHRGEKRELLRLEVKNSDSKGQSQYFAC